MALHILIIHTRNSFNYLSRIPNDIIVVYFSTREISIGRYNETKVRSTDLIVAAASRVTLHARKQVLPLCALSKGQYLKLLRFQVQCFSFVMPACFISTTYNFPTRHVHSCSELNDVLGGRL